MSLEEDEDNEDSDEDEVEVEDTPSPIRSALLCTGIILCICFVLFWGVIFVVDVLYGLDWLGGSNSAYRYAKVILGVRSAFHSFVAR